MQTDKRAGYVARDRILKLLSEVELARVSSAETAARLSNGDEYLDLAQLGQGVRRAPAEVTPQGRMLPRKAVRGRTWKRILAVLAAP
ncbi:MAG: hypothetical protein ABIY55_07725 [Kofleriaceae bacterium]